MAAPDYSAQHAAPAAGATLPTAVPMLDFSRQYALLREEILAAIEQVCNSQKYILGDEVAAFERQAAAACQVPHAVGCASGTDALWLAMAAAGIGPGDAVITSPFSFFATVSSILRCGAQPLLADIDPATYNLDPAAVERVLQSPAGGTVKAIMPVHLYGQCADWDGFTRLKEKYEVLLIEDAAQAFGATWTDAHGHTTPAGALGDLAAFSFYPTKNLSAYGDAGLVTAKDEVLAERARMLRAHGMRRRYYHDEIGWNSRLDTIQAAILLVKLRYIDQWNSKRGQLAAQYDKLFLEAGLGQAEPASSAAVENIALPYTAPQAGHVFHQYVIRSGDRDGLRAWLTEQRIGSEIYYPLPLHLQQSLTSLGYKQGDLPLSEIAAEQVLALPMYPELRTDEQERVVSAIAEYVQRG